MASIEFIQKRIEGKEKELTKLEKKMERILKAQEGNWEVNNPYSYSERDLRVTTKELEAAKYALIDYQNKLNAEYQKAASRNIPAILKFLADWKVRVFESYRNLFQEYLVDAGEWRAYSSKHTEWANSKGWKLRREDREEYNRIENEYRAKKKAYESRWNFITPFVEYRWVNETKEYILILNEDKLQKMLDQEADAKYDFIIERTNAIVGQITDASNLTVGQKGDLNGYIIGTDGKAKVQTIGAGGYNIQVFHYRTLINKMD